MKKIFRTSNVDDGHQSAANKGRSTEGFSKIDKKIKKYSKDSSSQKNSKILINSQNSTSMPARIRSEVSSSENQ